MNGSSVCLWNAFGQYACDVQTAEYVKVKDSFVDPTTVPKGPMSMSSGDSKVVGFSAHGAFGLGTSAPYQEAAAGKGSMMMGAGAGAGVEGFCGCAGGSH